MVSTFGNCALRCVNARTVKAIGSPSAPRSARMPMRECNVIAGLFTTIRRDIRSNCREFAKTESANRAVLSFESLAGIARQRHKNKTVRRPVSRSHRQSTHER
ncbi:hypothetical protein [Burkholderia anthina]|uniref:hypothetical protein n=1 Tax=Burkholderia anthina TaxID=179879 RepID=UPI0037BF8254